MPYKSIITIILISLSIFIASASLSDIHILHFNDVYQIFEWKKEPVAGYARFKTAINHFQNLDPLILFSGDAFSPSTLTPITRGSHMASALNDLGVHASCMGNHEFDIEYEELEKRVKDANFPWLLTNVLNADTGKPLAGAKEFHIIEKFGHKIGIFCLAESSWVKDILTFPKEDVIYLDFVETAKKFNKMLRNEHSCDVVIALTHMRSSNDRKLAEQVHDLDIILGGHDHVNELIQVNGTYFVKSGCEFQQFSRVSLFLKEDAQNSTNQTHFKRSDDQLSSSTNDTEINNINKSTTKQDEKFLATKIQNQERELYKDKYYFERETIIVNRTWEPDVEAKKFVQQQNKLLQESFKVPQAYSLVDLETRFEKIRTSEQNFPNLINDIIRLSVDTDIAYLGAGTFRSDRLFKKRIIKFGDIKEMQPFLDLLMMVEINGKQLLDCLENGVSWYPDFVGKFPSVSGIKFKFDPEQEPGKRIVKDSVFIEGKGPLQMDAKYTIATSSYLAKGGDGYLSMAKGRYLNDITTAEDLVMVVMRFFDVGKIPNIKKEWDMGILNQCKIVESEFEHKCVDFNQPPFNNHFSQVQESGKKKQVDKIAHLIHGFVEIENNQTLVVIAPEIEGRIVNIRDEKYKARQNDNCQQCNNSDSSTQDNVISKEKSSSDL